MQFPESWLREFCNPPLSTEQLADLLTMSGMEVEELRPVAPPFSNVVVAEVLEVARHPNADRLNVCHVRTGNGTTLNIVCGAPNVRPGIKVPCALVGAKLPPAEEGGAPFEIKLGKLRGVESQGMLCSARELKLSEDHGGLLILADDAPVGAPIREHLKLDDTLFTLKLTPNLGHGLSVYGIAREVAALTGSPLLKPGFPQAKVVHSDTLPVRIEAADLCGRFSGRIVRGVDTKAKTPAWMVDRLARCGQRSVTALVDISNYVMFEFGRPSHIFDLDKIHGGLVVRWGRKGEQLKLLNGNTIEVDEQVGVIADDRAVESLAGIMGGDATAVSDDTRNVYVEAAFWWPEAVAGRSRRYNFSTDAGHRFERGVDPSQTVEHIERITQLILDICGGEPGAMDDQTVRLPARKPVSLRIERAAKVIGMPVTQAQCVEVLRRLGLEVSEAPGVLTVTPPSWRFDLQIEEDLIEEVVRVLGYQNLPDTPPVAPIRAHVRSESRRGVHALRHALAALDYQETINFSFVEERWERELAGNDNPIRVLNPIASPLSVMRSGLIGSLVSVLRFNLARKATRVRISEVGRVFKRDAAVADGAGTVAGIEQPLRVAGLAYESVDELQWGIKSRQVDFFDVKGDVEALLAPRVARFVPAAHPALHPGRSARVEVDGRAIGFVGELHPQWRQAYELPGTPVVFELDAAALMEQPLPVFQAIPRQQSAWRDIAVMAGEQVSHDALIEAAKAANSQLVRSAKLFDVYKPTTCASTDMAAGERSLALRLEILDDSTTMTDERIESVKAEVVAALNQKLGVRLRA
ncbi:phenylalanine--tRNA ligase subunit beta [Piscinibacter gummiphilus]|uniref:Phenylalanine--tRNA ligase beta subunit n=1 Tax=Piscinibacter gummiphilus TaxID=946333 RepID=A0ABZ0D006_9BURK|nr:phenylalanine--tRNA ligase subunit beta [Piscinibacter gummiphilus]WOB10548.1 phenylalanine--tRNA ligase subunit beta [Piscinibacter gummiphilus]